VENRVAQDSQVTERINLYLVGIYASGATNSRANLFVPIGIYEDDDRPADLLLVEARLSVGSDKIVGPRNSLQDDIGARRIFHACDHDRRPAILDNPPGRMQDAGHLLLNPNLVSCETC
jgi:hypothetical protein